MNKHEPESKKHTGMDLAGDNARWGHLHPGCNGCRGGEARGDGRIRVGTTCDGGRGKATSSRSAARNRLLCSETHRYVMMESKLCAVEVRPKRSNGQGSPVSRRSESSLLG